MADVVCPRCRSFVALALANTGRPFQCGGCGHQVYLDVFPAAFRQQDSAGDETGAADAGKCYFHEERAAKTACDGCGRYLCSLCDIPMGREHLCPECLAVRNRTGKRQSLPNERVSWDRVALGLALGPVLMWPVTVITAPAALFVAVRFWKQPGSLVARGRLKFVVAGLLAAAQILAWVYWGRLLFTA